MGCVPWVWFPIDVAVGHFGPFFARCGIFLLMLLVALLDGSFGLCVRCTRLGVDMCQPSYRFAWLSGRL